MDEIRTKRLTLRRFREEDAPEMHVILSDPQAMRYWSTVPHTDLAQSVAWIEATRSGPPDVVDDFAIVREGKVIGKAGAWQLPEIGILLHPDHWGEGLASEALSAVCADLFQRRPDLDHLTADVDPRNTASLRLLTGLGFVVTGHAKGTFQLGDELCDSTYLALPRPG